MAFSDTEIERLEQVMVTSTEKALRNVLQDRACVQAFWAGGLEAAQDVAKAKTGGLVLGALGGLLRKAWLFLLLAGVVYAVGGWQALPKLWAVISADGGRP